MTRTRSVLSKVTRPILFALGCIFLVVGVAGLVLPLLPGTVFLILSAACFTRSSTRFETWLLNHPKLGPSVVGWRESGKIPRRAKIIAISAMAFSFALTWFSGAPPVALWVAGIALSASALYVGTRPS